jgi:Ran GTPase-activating protein (RanGAP) involved in mRNA processing and transport
LQPYISAQTLTALDFGRNRIGNRGTQYLADLIETNPVSFIFCLLFMFFYLYFLMQRLDTLDLSYNEISTEGAQNLADALRNNTVNNILSSCIFDKSLFFNKDTLRTEPMVQ